MTTFRKTAKPTWTLDTDGDYEIGGVSTTRRGRVLIHIVKVSGYDGTVTVKARATGSGQPYLAIPYIKRLLNGSVADDSVVNTGITDTSLIMVEADGQDICLTGASRTTGSMSVTVNKVLAG